MNPARVLARLTRVLLTGLLLAPLAGCGKTLIFAEHEGVNFAIRANASSQPPIEVNFGLDSALATIVPPAGQVDGRPKGDAVNLFAGFQVDRDGSILTDTQRVKVSLRIATQFASGQAALEIANKPSVVAKIVNTSSGFDSSGTCLSGYLSGLGRTGDARKKKQAEMDRRARELATAQKLPQMTRGFLSVLELPAYAEVRDTLVSEQKIDCGS